MWRLLKVLVREKAMKNESDGRNIEEPFEQDGSSGLHQAAASWHILAM